MEYAILLMLFLIFVNTADDRTLRWLAVGCAVVVGGYLLFIVAVLAFFAWPWSQFF
jgi:hypothetical protein